MLVERVRALAYTSNVDIVPLRRALLGKLRRGDEPGACALLNAALPAWAARCALPLLDPEIDDGERFLEIEERLMDAGQQATRWMMPLRASATIASGLGFIGAAAEIYWVFNGDHGLAALEAGRVESLGLTAAVLSIAIGIATSSLALGSWVVLERVARARVRECRRLVAAVEERLACETAD